MNTVKAITLLVFLLALGSVLLKEGLHVEYPKDKMLKAMARPSLKHYPKGFLVLVGSLAIIFALYFAFKFIFLK